jgi:hypothetical protein
MSAMVQLSGQPTDDPLAALEALLTMVAEKAVQFSADQEVDADTVAAMKAAGVYRALVPVRFGGDEKVPPISCG